MARYDEDHNDSRQFCAHGTFIGSWWGPDYLCAWCEDGVSVVDMERILAEQRAREMARAEASYEAMRTILAEHPFNVRVAQALVERVWTTAF